jgi:transposase
VKLKKMKTEIQTNSSEPAFAAFVGIDWADEKHAYALAVPGSREIERGEIQQTPEAIQQWVETLRVRFAGQPIAIALELTRGPLVWALCAYEFLALYPFTPQASARFRGVLHPSGAKSDPSDAQTILKMVIHHRDLLHRLRLDDPDTRLLEQLCRDRRDAVEERTRCVLRLTATLKEYFPLAPEVFGPLKNNAACRCLLKWGSLAELQAAPLHVVRKFLHGLNCRVQIEERLNLIAPAKPLTTDLAVVESRRRKAQLMAELILVLNNRIQEYDERINELFQRHPDRQLFDNLPGAGAALAPRLLVAFGLDRSRWESAALISSYSGIAPIEISSGKSRHHKMRRACPKYLRQTFHEFAAKAVTYCPWSRKYYEIQIANGKTHHHAIRSLALKWQRILWACWMNNTPYDEATYLKTLQQNGSPYALDLKAAA